jgi:TRAP-type C4-dicarboxylate transport system permease small subunit
MKQLERLSQILDDITSSLSGILISVLTIATLGGVFYRYVLGKPLDWIYELTIVCFSWMIFLGIAMAFKKNEHIAISFVVDNLPPKASYYLRQIINLICLAFLLVAAYHGILVTMSTMSLYYDTIPVSKGIFYLSMPISAIPASIHILVHVLRLRANYKGGRA